MFSIQNFFSYRADLNLLLKIKTMDQDLDPNCGKKISKAHRYCILKYGFKFRKLKIFCSHVPNSATPSHRNWQDIRFFGGAGGEYLEGCNPDPDRDPDQ
jgi:hypothetical protein